MAHIVRRSYDARTMLVRVPLKIARRQLADRSQTARKAYVTIALAGGVYT